MKRSAIVERLNCDPLLPSLLFCTPRRGSWAAGVGQFFGLISGSVCHDEDPRSFLRRADFFRAEYAHCSDETKALKRPQNGLKAEGKMAGDILEKTPAQAISEFADDPLDVGPQVPLVFLASALARICERLARVSGQESVEGAGEWPAVEGGDVVPNWGRGEIAGSLSCDDGLTGILFDLDPAPGVELWLGEHEPQIKSASAACERQSVPGTQHHVIGPRQHDARRAC